MWTFLSLFSLSLSLSLSLDVSSRMTLENGHPLTPTNGWVLDESLQRRQADGPHKLVFALSQRNLDELSRWAEAASYPDSPYYADYRTPQEVRDLVAPTFSAAAAVQNWVLEETGKGNVLTSLFF